MKKPIRILALICIVAALTSSIAFAVVPFPTQPPLSQTFIVVPSSRINGNIIEMYASTSLTTVVNRINVFQEVYTANGANTSATWSADATNAGCQYVKDEYDTSLIIHTGYIHSKNLIPASQARVVNVGNGALNYCSRVGDHSSGKGYLLTGDIVLFIGNTNVSDWVQVRVFDTKSSTFGVDYFVPASGLKAYSR